MCEYAIASSSRSDRISTRDGEQEIDAGGAVVAPGFIDCHTHYDPSIWWDPLVDPMPQHGVTTVVTGNCSLSLTPVRAADRARAADVFGFIEDIPVDAFATGIPWNWESYAEWHDALRMYGTAVNVAPLVGHSNLRVYVMGDDAWERAATPDERDRLAAVLAECLAAGALGLSTSFVDTDRNAHAVPSRAADADEFLALIDVLARAPGSARVLEFLPWIKEIDRQLDDIARVARWCGPRGVTCTWNQLAQARVDWDTVGDGFTIFPVNGLERVRLTSVRSGEERFLGASFAGVVEARGGHPSDVLADWVIEHDLAPGMMAESLSNNDSGKVAELVTDSTTVVGASDAGAHLQMMCGAGDSTLLLTEHVRDSRTLVLEAAVHELTGRIATAFGIRERGVVAPGYAGDLVVFVLDELSYLPDTFVHDLPGARRA